MPLRIFRPNVKERESAPPSDHPVALEEPKSHSSALKTNQSEIMGACMTKMSIGNKGLHLEIPKTDECKRQVELIEKLPNNSKKYLNNRIELV